MGGYINVLYLNPVSSKKEDRGRRVREGWLKGGRVGGREEKGV